MPRGVGATLAAALLSVILVNVGGAQDVDNLRLTPQKATDIPAPKNDPKAIAVLERYLAAIGGRDLLNAINDKTVEFDTVKHAPTGETTARLKLFVKRGFLIREEWDLPGFQISDKKLKFVQVYDGFDGWVQMFGTISRLEGRTLSIFVWDKPIDNPFMHWQEDGYSVELISDSEQVEGEPSSVVQMSDFYGRNKSRYYFSNNTGLLLKKEWRDQETDGIVSKSNLFLRYRDISFFDDTSKKLKVSLHQKVFVGEDLQTERVFSSYLINTGLRDAIFDRPEGVEFTGGIGPGASAGPGGLTPQQVFDKYDDSDTPTVSDQGQSTQKKPVKRPKPVALPKASKK